MYRATRSASGLAPPFTLAPLGLPPPLTTTPFRVSTADSAVLASPTCDIGLIGYEMTLLVDRVGQLLTPELRSELQGSFGGH